MTTATAVQNGKKLIVVEGKELRTGGTEVTIKAPNFQSASSGRNI